MLSAAARMKQLIVDLLTYSRASTAERNFEMANLNLILNSVLDVLKESIEQKQAVIESAQLPTLRVIPYQIEQLMTNLISNALSFSKKDEPPHIKITSDMVRGSKVSYPGIKDVMYYRIVIKDNGIGFDPQFSDRIFPGLPTLAWKRGLCGHRHRFIYREEDR